MYTRLAEKATAKRSSPTMCRQLTSPLFSLAGCGKSLNRDGSPPQGLKPSLVLHDLRGAKAPLYHSAAGFRDFFRSLLGVCMPRKSSRKNPSRPARADGVLTVMDSARRGELVAIVGTGVSIGLTDNKIPALSWRGLILHGFAHGVQKGTISAAQEKAWRMQLDSNDLDDLLGAAEFMG